MNFTDYQILTEKTAQFPRNIAIVKDYNDLTYMEYLYPVLGLVGEAGEVAEKIKKIVRNNLGEYTEKDKEELKKEIGDVLWYCAALCSVLEISLDEVAQLNVDKLMDRMRRGVIKSKGDSR